MLLDLGRFWRTLLADPPLVRSGLVLLASLVDVVNSTIGIADGNPLAALILCIGRLNIAYGVLEFVPEVRVHAVPWGLLSLSGWAGISEDVGVQ